MSRTPNAPSTGLQTFELNQEDMLHIAASLASDLGCASGLMPAEFRERHFVLLELFVARLTPQNRQRVLGAMTSTGDDNVTLN